MTIKKVFNTINDTRSGSLAKFTVKSRLSGVNKPLFTPEEPGFWFLFLV